MNAFTLTFILMIGELVSPQKNLEVTKMKSKKLFTVVSVLVMLVLLLVPATPAFASPAPDGGPGGRGGDIVNALRQIAQTVIDILIGISVILMAVGIATGFVGGQFMVTVGQPYGLSSAWVKVVSVVLLGVGAMLTITIVNTLIKILAGLIPATVIPSV